jgi:hypothetical protein
VDGEFEEILCYPIIECIHYLYVRIEHLVTDLSLNRNITSYLNIPSIQSILGIDPSYVRLRTAIISLVSLEPAHPTQFYVEQLLHRGAKVLIYVSLNVRLVFICSNKI